MILKADQPRGTKTHATPVPLMTTDQLAEYLGVSPYTLYDWRVAGAGPPFLRAGAQYRYRLSEVDEWLAGTARERP